MHISGLGLGLAADIFICAWICARTQKSKKLYYPELNRMHLLLET